MFCPRFSSTCHVWDLRDRKVKAIVNTKGVLLDAFNTYRRLARSCLTSDILL